MFYKPYFCTLIINGDIMYDRWAKSDIHGPWYDPNAMKVQSFVFIKGDISRLI